MTENRKRIMIRNTRRWILNRLLFFILLCQIPYAVAQDSLPAPFQTGEYWGYKDAQGRVIIAARFLIAMPFTRYGLAAVVDDSGWVYIDKQGEILVRPYLFDNGPDYFREGLARYVADDKIGFIDESGHIVIPAAFDFAAPFSEGLAAFCQGCKTITEGEHTRYTGGRWGYINKQGKTAILPRYESASAFSAGVAEVSLDGQISRIDESGKILP